MYHLFSLIVLDARLYAQFAGHSERHTKIISFERKKNNSGKKLIENCALDRVGEKKSGERTKTVKWQMVNECEQQLFNNFE